MKLLLTKLTRLISKMIDKRFKKKKTTDQGKNTWENNSDDDWDQYGDYIAFERTVVKLV